MMPDIDGASEWDFVTLVAWWNLYGLPLLLAAVAVIAVARNRYRTPLTSAADGARALSYCGYIHFALALRALIHLVQELLTLRVMGIPQSFPVVGLLSPAVSVLVDPLLGLGLLRRRRAARWCAIAWYLFWSSIAVYVIHWLWHNNVPIDPAAWPDHVVSYGLTRLSAGCHVRAASAPRVCRSRHRPPALETHHRRRPLHHQHGPLSRCRRSCSSSSCSRP